MAGTSPAMTARERGRGEERLQPQINSEAGFAGIKWDKWDSAGQPTPGLLCRGPMTLPSAHHGAIFAQAPRPVHRTLVRVSRACLQGHARGTRIANARQVVRGGEGARSPPSPIPGPLRPMGLRAFEKERSRCRLRPPSAFGGGGQGEVGLGSPASSGRHEVTKPELRVPDNAAGPPLRNPRHARPSARDRTVRLRPAARRG